MQISFCRAVHKYGNVANTMPSTLRLTFPDDEARNPVRGGWVSRVQLDVCEGACCVNIVINTQCKINIIINIA